MSLLHRIRPGRVVPSRMVMAVSGLALLFAGPALAQTVRVFDDAPTMEQLRSIMIPESQPSMGRTIVIQRPDTGASSVNVQHVAAQVMPAQVMPAQVMPAQVKPAPRQPVASEDMAVPAPSPEKVVASAAPQSHPAAKPATEAKSGTVGFRINFAFNSAVLPEAAQPMIERVAQLMKEAPEIKVRVEGHTDAVGGADYNVSLSERRSLSVGAYLVKLGIEPSRLMLVGKGMAEPLTANPYDPNNRRVQFVRVG